MSWPRPQTPARHQPGFLHWSAHNRSLFLLSELGQQVSLPPERGSSGKLQLPRPFAFATTRRAHVFSAKWSVLARTSHVRFLPYVRPITFLKPSLASRTDLNPCSSSLKGGRQNGALACHIKPQSSGKNHCCSSFMSALPEKFYFLCSPFGSQPDVLIRLRSTFPDSCTIRTTGSSVRNWSFTQGCGSTDMMSPEAHLTAFHECLAGYVASCFLPGGCSER